MPTTALVLALSGAFLHAGWNALLARSPDTRGATSVALLAPAVVFAPLALAIWHVSWGAAPFVVASTALELCYFALLATAYQRAEMSLIYPLARGLGPCLVLLISVIVLGVPTSALGTAGVLSVAAGVVLVRGIRTGAGAVELGLAVAIGGCIAGYTLIDKAGLQFADPISYFWLVTAATGGGYLIAIVGRRGRGALRAHLRPVNAVAGLAMFVAYALVLEALRIAPAAPVAAVRETSVVIAAILGALVLHERVGPLRLAGAVIVALGVAALAAG